MGNGVNAADNAVTRADGRRNPSRKEIAKSLSSIKVKLESLDIDVDTDKAIAIPLDQLPALGVAFASLPNAIRTVVGSVSVPDNLFFVNDAFGNPLNAAALQHFKDGSGLLASFRDAINGFGQARLHEAAGGAFQTTGVMPYDPTMLFIAAAIMQINGKLDAIQDTQRRMFRYLQQKDKAQLRGDAETLVGILNDYQYNWDNDVWRDNSHMKVLDIRQDMATSSIHLRAQISTLLKEGGFLEVRGVVGKRSDDIADVMKEYQLATYNHAFASFLEPMLSENLDAEYLTKIADDIEDRRLDYLRFYTDCYNAIEKKSNESVEGRLLDGVSFLGRKLGETISSTPIGDHIPVDDTLIGMGDAVNRFNMERTDALLARMRDARLPHVRPFCETVRMLNRLHNAPMVMAADGDDLYLLPQKRA
ncbi:hypothetical protein [Bifidobacterium parmae]|uniref:UvrABC system protein B n=1 Tax=Bifidobacterium parmae TaxID=361854 RepID=A0A2N5J0C2_9BIFI|nr:hypothetical protein [Bifidobacterium parmae]PLS27655.1 UvrABC system protein B [Bifidobacterium parmae]